MGSLVIELQREALDSNVPVAELLRKALVVARKLNIKEFEQWIHQELNGNFNGQSGIPPYRHMTGEVKVFNPYYGWQHVIFEDPKIGEKLSTREIGQPIGEIEALIKNQRDSSICQVPFPKDLQAKIMSSIGSPTPPTFIVGYAQMQGVIDAARKIVLEWSLKLEEDGILGADMSFSNQEKEAAANFHCNIENLINNVSHSQIQQGTISSYQEVEIDSECKGKIELFIHDLKKNLQDLSLDQDEQQKVSSEVELLERQLSQEKPKKSIIRSCLASVRVILENTVGSAGGAILVAKLLSLGLL